MPSPAVYDVKSRLGHEGSRGSRQDQPSHPFPGTCARLFPGTCAGLCSRPWAPATAALKRAASCRQLLDLFPTRARQGTHHGRERKSSRAERGTEAVIDFQRLSAHQLLQDLIQVHAAIRLSSVPTKSRSPMSEAEHAQWRDLCALAAMERRLVRELRRRRTRLEAVSASPVPTATSLRSVRQPVD